MKYEKIVPINECRGKTIVDKRVGRKRTVLQFRVHENLKFNQQLANNYELKIIFETIPFLLFKKWNNKIHLNRIRRRI